ncbi:MAG: hypothetical protein JXK05_00035 [Campylobacterales bacterium]|nr:hypothetical protein [Campylobacterales bacterium]
MRTQRGLVLKPPKLVRVGEGVDFLGYIIRPHYRLVRRRIVNNFKRKKARYLDAYEAQKGTMRLAEIKQFLAVQASFKAHAKHADSYHLLNTIGAIHENDPFAFDRR